MLVKSICKFFLEKAQKIQFTFGKARWICLDREEKMYYNNSYL